MSAAFLYTHAAAMLVAATLASAGTYKVMDNAQRAEASARLEDERLASELRETDARQQRRFGDIGAGQHATALASINNKLGDARAHIARLSDRQCLGADTVRMLNAIGPAARGVGLRAPAGHAAGAAATLAGSATDAAPGYASERNTADHIATCRARYAAVSDQVNQILDIEEQRGQSRAVAH